MLGDGIARCRKAIDSDDAGKATGDGPQGPSLPAAMLALAQIHITEGRPAEAIALLEDPGIAAGDSCCLALLAYVATGQLDKAKICLQTLQASLPPRPAMPMPRGKRCRLACVSIVS